MSDGVCGSVLQRRQEAMIACNWMAAWYVQIDTARKLRWYDREDLSQLISITTKEKQQLQETISALRKVPQLISQAVICSARISADSS